MKNVSKIFAELDEMEDQHFAKIVEDIENIRRQYPDTFLLKTAVSLATEQLRKNDAHINKHRLKYKSLKSFKERKEYYDKILISRERGYKLCNDELLKFLADPKVKPYEAWVTETTYSRMKRRGYQDTILNELLFGNLI